MLRFIQAINWGGPWANWKKSFEEQIEVIFINESQPNWFYSVWMNEFLAAGRPTIMQRDKIDLTQDIYHKKIVNGHGVWFCDADGVIEY